MAWAAAVPAVPSAKPPAGAPIIIAPRHPSRRAWTGPLKAAADQIYAISAKPSVSSFLPTNTCSLAQLGRRPGGARR